MDGWARIINDNPQFDGMEFAQPDEMVRMPGANSDAPAWIECAMYRKDRTRPVIIREYLDEAYREPFKGQVRACYRPVADTPETVLAAQSNDPVRSDGLWIWRHLRPGRGRAHHRARHGRRRGGLEPSRTARALPDYSQSAFAANLPKWSA